MNNSAPPPPDRVVYSVSQLNEEARLLLETALPLLWVEGEISNLARPASGHMYFTLKDARAQVRCAMFRGRNQLLRTPPRSGDQVLVRARVSLYPARGDYQLIVEHLEPAGDGLLRRAFEELKARLQAEGLFDEAAKRPLPAMPRRLGVVTSPTGAAIHDVLTVLRRRFPLLEVVLYPVPVQGEGAAPKIAQAIAAANRRAEVDLLLLTRGGGSLEDLWAFNEEVVARAVHDSELPIVCAVGHEVDFSIAEFAADQRAATPSAAAELISPDAAAWLAAFEHQERQLRAVLEAQLQRRGQAVDWIEHRLRQCHPGRRLGEQSRRVEELEHRLRQCQTHRLSQAQATLLQLRQRLDGCTPGERIGRLQARLADLSHRLQTQLQHELARRRQQVGALARELDAVSPLATLGRGYAIVQDARGRVLRDAAVSRPGDSITARLGRGRLHCRVEASEPGTEDDSGP